MHALASIARRSCIARPLFSNALPTSIHAGKCVQFVRYYTVVPRKSRPAPLSKSNRLGTDGLAELRYTLARDSLKQYQEGDKNDELLERALADNKVARDLRADTKYFLQMLEILCAGKRYREVIDEVNANIFVYNNNSNLLEYRAHAYMKIGNYEKALEDTVYMLVNFEAGEKDKEGLYQQKVECEMALGKHEVAYETVKLAMKKGIFLEKALQAVVDNLDNIPEAMALLDEEIKKQGEPSAELLLCRAYFHNQSGNPEKALADYNAAPAGDKKSDFFVEYGDILERLGRFQEEVDVLQSQVGSQNDCIELRELILSKQFFLFQFVDVMSTANAAKSIGEMTESEHYLGETQMIHGEYQQALDRFSHMIKIEQERKEEKEEQEGVLAAARGSIDLINTGHYGRAMCYVMLGEPSKALTDLESITNPALAKKALEKMEQMKDSSRSLTRADFACLEAAGLHYSNGLLKKHSKKYDQAVVEFSKALECDQLNLFPLTIWKLTILLARASCYEPLRRFTESLADCETILDIFPCDSKKVLNVQQACLSAIERYDDIANIIQTYHILNDPRDCETPHLARALAYFESARDYQRAYEELYKCEHQDTLEWQKLNFQVCHELYKIDEAIQAVNKFLQRKDISEQDRGWALQTRAENVVRQLQKEPGSKESLDKAVKQVLRDIDGSIQMYPDGEEDAIILRAHVYYAFTKQYDKAIESYSSLSNHLKAHFGIATCLKAMNKREEATKHLEKILKHTEEVNDDEDVIAFRARVLHQLGQYEAAIANYSMSILIGQHDTQFVATCYHQRAEAYLQLGDAKKAEQDLKRAIELNPSKKEEYLQLDLTQAKKRARGSHAREKRGNRSGAGKERGNRSGAGEERAGFEKRGIV